MSDYDKKEDLLRELEIQSILEESRDLADIEQMKRNAQKYRAKPKVQDIFSNADQKPRLENADPLTAADEEKVKKADKKAKAKSENTIVGDKTATTIQTELMMDGSAENVPAVGSEPEDDKPAAAEPELPEEEKEIVTLTPEYADDARFAGDVIGEVDTFRESSPIESIQSIDIDMDEQNYEQKQKMQEDEKQQKYRELFQEKEDGKPAKHVVSRVPVYQPEEPSNLLNVKAGRFSEVVETQYEEYIRSKNPSVMAHVIRPEPKHEEAEEEKPRDERSVKEKVISAVVGFFSRDESDDTDTPKQNTTPVEDYTGEEDEQSIRYELNSNIKKLFFRSLISGVIAAVAVLITAAARIFPDAIIGAIPVAPAAYAVFNFLLIGSSIVLNRVAMISGLTPLLKFKGNSDTAVAVAGASAVLQTLVSFFCLGDMSGFNVNYYSTVVLLAFFANNLGKLFLLLRVRDNFRFVSSKGQKYAAKIYNDENVANKMLSGTPADRTLIAYQHKTKFPSNFLKISYAPDPSEDLASKMAPVTTIAAAAIALLYGVIKLDFADAVNTFSLITALGIPVATLLAVNLPVRRLCKKLIGYDAMLAGYPSIKQFCDSTAVMIDANELFPADTIELEGIKTFEEFNVDESLLCGIAILKEAQNPIANAFESVVTETRETLPEVESVLYEDDLGLVGWINGERILVGSRQLMEKYSVDTPAADYEAKYAKDDRQITYLARAGRPVAMLVTKYHADSELKSEMQRAEANGISFLIRTTDYNITDELVAKLYNLFYRSIKVLPTGLGNVLKEAQSVTEETSRSYLITGGKASSMSRAVSGCVRIKQNISLAIMIQLIAVIAGIMIAATLSLYAGVGVMGSLEVFIYAVFWAAATLIAPSVQKP
ncbi:MAG: hypothetical protein UIH27_03710 [Ruminococcus sp.]|nr:hypothetical protein [Ruminococcus sp.]